MVPDATVNVTRPIVFVDVAVAEAAAHLTAAGLAAEVVRLHAGRPALAQMADHLDGRANVEAIHVLSHGQDGALLFASGAVTAETLPGDEGELARIGRALAEEAGLLLYGCSVVETVAGQAFIARIATMTGAAVAASPTRTGAADKGGTWRLEGPSGTVAAARPLIRVLEPRFTGLLAPSVGTTTFGTTFVSISALQNNNQTASGTNNGFTITQTNVDASSSTFIAVLTTPPDIGGGGDANLGATANANAIDRLTLVADDASYMNVDSLYFAWTQTSGGASATITFTGLDGATTLGSKAVTLTAGTGGGVTQSSINLESPDSGSFDYIKELRIQLASGQAANGVYLDDIVLSTAVAPNNAPVVASPTGDAAFTEGGGAVAVDAALTVTDAESDTISGATVSVTGGFASGDILAVTDGSGISSNYNSGTGVLTLNGTTTAANYQTVLRTLTFNSTSDTPSTSARTLTYAVTDTGSSTAGSVTQGVTVAAVNDAPVFANLNGTPAFTEGGSAVPLDADVTVSDAELDALNGASGDYSGASLTIARNGGANADDRLSIVTGGSLTVAGGPDGGGTVSSGGNVIATISNTGNGQLQVTFADNGTTPTTALVNEVMQAVRYSNASNAPPSSAQLDWTLNDGNSGSQGTGGALTATGSTPVSITGVNDEPTLTATGADPSYTEGGSAVALFTGAAASTIETSQSITGLTLTVTNVADGANEILTLDGSDVALTDGKVTTTNGLAVTVSVSGSTATVSFSGASMTPAEAQAGVDALAYRNTSDNPSTGSTRVVTITQMTDSGGTANSGDDTVSLSLASTVSLTAVNSPPVVGGVFGDTASMVTAGAGAVNVTGLDDATVTNADSADYDGGTLTIVDSGPTNGSWGLDGTTATSGKDGTFTANETVSIGGTAIGTVDATNDGLSGNTLTIAFNSDATSARIQTLLRALTYDAPSTDGARSFTVTLDDGDGTANGGDADASGTFGLTVGASTPSNGGGGGGSTGGQTTTTTTEGTKVTTTTTTNSNGTVTQTKTIAPFDGFQPGEDEDDGANALSDHVLAGSGAAPALTASLPMGVGLTSSGATTPRTPTDPLLDLIDRIETETESGSQTQTHMTGVGRAFLNGLSPDTPLYVNTITPTVSGAAAPDGPILITGADASAGEQEALVIDTRGLPSGTTLQLENVEFAAIVGESTVTGGSGDNIAVGDGSDQFIRLGEGDDILDGGAGDDVVGSLGGDDILIGGDGNDTVTGGTGVDVAQFAESFGTSQVQRAEGATVVRSGGTADVGADVEILVFAEDGTSTLTRIPDATPLAGLAFDSTFYATQNADVATAVTAGIFSDAQAHALAHGLDEGRAPNPFWDEAWYLEANPDVAAAIANGWLTSALRHYATWGADEGRDPGPWFDAAAYLAANPDVADAGMDPLFHFVLHGVGEGRTGYVADTDMVFA